MKGTVVLGVSNLRDLGPKRKPVQRSGELIHGRCPMGFTATDI